MNKTKIETFDYTWNPITGCTVGCHYCYARRIALRFQGNFEPKIHWDRLDELSKLKMPARIFVCSMGDLYDKEVEEKWRIAVYVGLRKFRQHQYFILTKQPQNIDDIGLLNLYGLNVFLGVTITGKDGLRRIEELRGKYLTLKWPQGFLKLFISFEPLLDDVGKLNLKDIDWVILGA